MARHKRSYSGERRTAALRLQLTPSERAELDAAATRERASLSDFTRELVFRRMAAPGTVARTRRNPEAAGIMRALLAAAYEHNANGNNLNQIARHANTTGELADRGEALDEALALQKKAAELHILALERVLAL
jgi:hypothetical protein